MNLINKPMEQLEFRLFQNWITYPISTVYSVHRSGIIRNDKTLHILKPVRLKSGYEQVTIAGVKRYVHQIMCESFYGDYSTTFEPDHKDRNRGNNSIENLELITHRENCQRRGKFNLST